MKNISIDIGSTHIKSALIDSNSNQIAFYRVEPTPKGMSNRPYSYTIDANELYDQIAFILDRLLQAVGEECVGVRLSTQMHGFLLSDTNGLPLTPYVSWRDNRCLREWKGTTGLQYLESLILPEHMEHCGVYLKPGLAFCNAWMLTAQKEYEVPKGSRFCTLGSYLIARLSGRNACHITNAAATGFYNVRDGKWDEGFITLAGLEEVEFPDVLPEREVCAQVIRNKKRLLLFPDIGDHQMAILGSMLHPEGDVNVNIATAGQLARIEQNFCPGNYEIRPYFEGCFLNTVTRLPAGRNMDVLVSFFSMVARDLFQIPIDFNELYIRLSQLSPNVSAGRLTMDLSFFGDSLDGGPGGICGIEENNLTPAGLFYAAIEATAHSYAVHLNDLENSRRPSRLVFTGGFARKQPLVMEAVSRITGLPSVFPAYEEEILIGHFRLLLIDSGICKNIDETLKEIKCRSLQIQKA